MHRNLTISVVIPCYNEEDGIQHVIHNMPRCVDEVVVVDNNSTDRTGEVARALGARVVRETRKGYGAAYKAGLPAATCDVVATLDGDGSYPAEAIPELVDLLLDRDLDFISACRFPLKTSGSMNTSNWIGNMVLTAATAVLYGVPVKDSQSGMWVFRRPVYNLLRVSSDGMAFSEEIKIEAIRHPRVRFAEHHIDYRERIGEVKLNKWRDGFTNLLFLVTKRFAKTPRVA
jgi:glycosyltransferase involved in cell wall biosynthesis